jgi:glutathione S-transferase
MSQLQIVGRSSSHFTRTSQLFALELELPYEFRPVLDMTSLEAGNYGDNPALKVPILIDEQGPLYGTENICRELLRRSGRTAQVVMRGDVSARLVLNAEELILSAMSAEVSLITARAANAGAAAPKLLRSIENCLDYLERHLDGVLAALPAKRQLSFVEATLFCLLRHLPFREVMSVDAWPQLQAYADHFGQRSSARATEYRFDRP